jgi:SAM-dependent methyltransferase
MNMDGYTGYRSWKKWSAENFGVCDRSSAAYFSAEATRSAVSKLAGLRVIELGFGNGVFAGWCVQCGANYIGTEVIQDLVERGRQSGFDMHLASADLAAVLGYGIADLVFSWDVFEHVEIGQLKRVLGDVHSLLRSGGLLIARFPSGDSPFARACQYGDTTHCTVLGSSAVSQLADELGFQVVQMREPRFVYLGIPFTSLIRRSIVECIRRIVFPAMTKIFMGGGAPVLTANMVVVLRRE